MAGIVTFSVSKKHAKIADKAFEYWGTVDFKKGFHSNISNEVMLAVRDRYLAQQGGLVLPALDDKRKMNFLELVETGKLDKEKLEEIAKVLERRRKEVTAALNQLNNVKLLPDQLV